MKKMRYSLLRWPCLLQDAQQTFTVQNKPAAVAPKETITHHFFVSGIGQKKNCRCSQNLWRRRNVVKKQKPSKTFVNGLLGFITLGHLYSAGSACVLLTRLHELPIDMGNSICTAH